MTVTAQYAAEHFNEISETVDQGQSVEISRPGKPTLVLSTVRVEEAATKRVLGTGIGQLTRVPDHEEWSALDRELWGELLDESAAS